MAELRSQVGRLTRYLIGDKAKRDAEGAALAARVEELEQALRREQGAGSWEQAPLRDQQPYRPPASTQAEAATGGAGAADAAGGPQPAPGLKQVGVSTPSSEAASAVSYGGADETAARAEQTRVGIAATGRVTAADATADAGLTEPGGLSEHQRRARGSV